MRRPVWYMRLPVWMVLACALATCAPVARAQDDDLWTTLTMSLESGTVHGGSSVVLEGSTAFAELDVLGVALGDLAAQSVRVEEDAPSETRFFLRVSFVTPALPEARVEEMEDADTLTVAVVLAVAVNGTAVQNVTAGEWTWSPDDGAGIGLADLVASIVFAVVMGVVVIAQVVAFSRKHCGCEGEDSGSRDGFDGDPFGADAIRHHVMVALEAGRRERERAAGNVAAEEMASVAADTSSRSDHRGDGDSGAVEMAHVESSAVEMAHVGSSAGDGGSSGGRGERGAV